MHVFPLEANQELERILLCVHVFPLVPDQALERILPSVRMCFRLSLTRNFNTFFEVYVCVST